MVMTPALLGLAADPALIHRRLDRRLRMSSTAQLMLWWLLLLWLLRKSSCHCAAQRDLTLRSCRGREHTDHAGQATVNATAL